MPFFVYMLAGQRNGTLYIGYTDDIFRRVTEHKSHSLGGFTAKYTSSVSSGTRPTSRVRAPGIASAR